jgi:diacylglycerol O-acyltransferase
MSNLRVEEHGMPMHVAALALLEGRPLLDEAGELLVEEIRRHVEKRVRGVERLHQVLVPPRARHATPVWEDDPGFEIADHVLTRRLPPPGDEQTLLRVCCALNAPPLDRSRPLWELWLLNGLADGRVALLLRLHHVVADGIAALELFSSMLDLGPGTPGSEAAPRAPEKGRPPATSPAPSPGTEAPPARSGIARVSRIATGVAVRGRQAWTLARGGRAPSLSWNQPVGSRRVLLLVRGDLALAKAVAHQHGGKLNDVVLAAVAGGAYRLLESRGELRSGLDLRVSVAASIRRPGETGGNRVGVRLVGVPIDDPDATSRLDTVIERTAAQRHQPPLQPSGRFLQRWTVHVMAHQRLINMVLSNVPGPPVPLWFAGARVQEVFQVSLLQGNCSIGVGVLSYAGQLNLDIVADPDLVPDVDVFADGVAEALVRLGAARAGVTGRAP